MVRAVVIGCQLDRSLILLDLALDLPSASVSFGLHGAIHTFNFVVALFTSPNDELMTRR